MTVILLSFLWMLFGHCCLAGSSKMDPRILIYSTAMGAKPLFYTKFIATYLSPPKSWHNNSFLGSVSEVKQNSNRRSKLKMHLTKIYNLSSNHSTALQSWSAELCSKGQLISECLYDVFKFSKKPTKNLIDSAQQRLLLQG